jgi:hypothetical protein
LAVAVIGLALGTIAPAQAANIVTNGSFETGDFTGWTLSGDTTFNGVQCPGAASNRTEIALPFSGLSVRPAGSLKT